MAGAVTAAMAGVFWVRKLMASTAAEVAGGRAEVNIIEVMQTENASLRERLTATERERNEQFQLIASLQADLKIIQASQDLLTKQIHELTATNKMLNEKVTHLSIALEARA